MWSGRAFAGFLGRRLLAAAAALALAGALHAATAPAPPPARARATIPAPTDPASVPSARRSRELTPPHDAETVG